MAGHRRVEPRMIAGSGLATDPERVREVEEDYERKQRAWREGPEKAFDDVLKEAPAKALLEGEEEDPRRAAAPSPENAEAADKKTEEKPEKSVAKDVLPKKGPRLPPDPRELLLKKQLIEGKLAPVPGLAPAQTLPSVKQQEPPKIAPRSPSETPPTGSRPAKP